MRIKSALLTQASGSIGGLTACHDSGGIVFKPRTIPTDPKTARQVEVRSAVSTLSSSWARLTQAQRDAWTLYGQNVPTTGPLGSPLILTGLQMFMRSNVPRLQAKLNRVNDGPTTFTLPTLNQTSLRNFSIVYGISIVFDDTQDWCFEPDSALLFYVGRPQGLAVDFFNGPYRFALTKKGVAITGTSSPMTTTNPWPMHAGNKNWVYTRLSLADGRLSVPQVLGPELTKLFV